MQQIYKDSVGLFELTSLNCILMTRLFRRPMVLILVFFFSLAALSADEKSHSSSTFELYQRGLQSLQQKKSQEAQNILLQALNQNPDNKFILYHLGLADYQLNNKGRAIGYWRKALYLDSHFSLADQALKFAGRELGPLSSNSSSQWEAFRQDFLYILSVNQSLSISALSLLFGGLLLIHYWAQRKKSFKDEKPLPAFPYWGSLIFFFFLLFGTLGLLQIYDSYHPRATVCDQRLEIRAGPHQDDAVLFTALEGHELIVKKVRDEWVQVASSGALTGWAPKASLLPSFGKNPW